MKAELICSIFVGMLFAGPVSAVTIAVTEAGNLNQYGNTDGVVIDFTTGGPQVNYTPAQPVAGSPYSIDSLSIWEENDYDADFYLGVYTGLSSSGGTPASFDPTGFLGISSNTINFSTVDNVGGPVKVTFNFNGISVTPNATLADTSDRYFFVLQTSTSDLSAIPDYGDNLTFIKRVDGDTSDPFGNYRAGVIDIGAGSTGVSTTRAPEYEVQLTLIPEPGSVLLALPGLGLLLRRRRQAGVADIPVAN